MNSCDALIDVLKENPKICSVRFFSFLTSTKLQDRYNIEESDFSSLIDEAIKLKKKMDVRFWHALLSLFSTTTKVDEGLMSHALYHQANSNYQYINAIDAFNFCMLEPECASALNSKVIMSNGSTRHIPLLDFKVKSQESNLGVVVAAVKAMRLRGYILDSGKSYHFIGLDLVSESELLDLLARFCLLAPISDSAWASHQIIERSASLRISPRNGVRPLVVHIAN